MLYKIISISLNFKKTYSSRSKYSKKVVYFNHFFCLKIYMDYIFLTPLKRSSFKLYLLKESLRDIVELKI